MVVSPKLDLPMLSSGDRLTRSEFERRYAACDNIKKAELIEGVVYVARERDSTWQTPRNHYHLVGRLLQSDAWCRLAGRCHGPSGWGASQCAE